MMIRRMMWVVLVVGVALIAAPFAMGLPGKAAGGQDMIDAFEPIMAEDNVNTTADYYYDVFVPLGQVAPAMSQENVDRFNGYLAGFGALGVDAENMVPLLAGAMNMPEADVQDARARRQQRAEPGQQLVGLGAEEGAVLVVDLVVVDQSSPPGSVGPSRRSGLAQ